MRYLFLLALGAQATRIARDGVVENIASTSRKHIGRRRVDLEVTGARLVVVTSRRERARPARADYSARAWLMSRAHGSFGRKFT